MPRSGHEGRWKNFTSEPTVWSGTSKVQKPPSLRFRTWESLGGQFHNNEINHIIFNRKYCLTVSVVPKFYMGSDHRLLRASWQIMGRLKVKLRDRTFEPTAKRTTLAADSPVPLEKNGSRAPTFLNLRGRTRRSECTAKEVRGRGRFSTNLNARAEAFSDADKGGLPLLAILTTDFHKRSPRLDQKTDARRCSPLQRHTATLRYK
ncbi:unnamed protein product [Heligmosomoides polygyrus]|uniref:Uncharacterized protein n=1 Tax=Heligmosomoides polygyrus TaxID=6339 RepID=A0A183FPE6_HELPZ|nr:unnamed protein product [Heligmosomoides polygyrus]